jgi:hypothetical protein
MWAARQHAAVSTLGQEVAAARLVARRQPNPADFQVVMLGGVTFFLARKYVVHF